MEPVENTGQTSAPRKTMRPAAVAGRFFPGAADELVKTVDGLLNNALRASGPASTGSPKALIVPHAGYRFSGEIAASAYITLLPVARIISRVVLLGPAHKVRIRGIGFTGADYFASPLGNIPVDTQTVNQLVSRFEFASINNKAHQHEHSLETQLPFLQRVIGKFSLVPAVVGAATPAQIAECLSSLWGGDETLILISSDLSHFKPYAEAREIDSFTSRAITSLNPDPITYEHACGQIGLRGLLSMARQKKLRVAQLDVRNSGDTAERKDQVVGYGSYGFYAQPARFNAAQRTVLSQLAKKSIEHGVATGQMLQPTLSGADPLLLTAGASFVTLNTGAGKLRGCIGTLVSHTPLYQNICQNAFKSAFHDGRFKPVDASELDKLRIEISVLGPWSRIEGESEEEVISQISPFVDGLIFKVGDRRGTFLPSVWKSIPDPATFFRQLKRKGGFAEDFWSEEVEVYRYTTETWAV